jgi:hypothetical protein
MPMKRYEVALLREYRRAETARVYVEANSAEEAKAAALTQARSDRSRQITWLDTGLNERREAQVDEVIDHGYPWEQRSAADRRDSVIKWLGEQGVTSLATEYTVTEGRLRLGVWVAQGPNRAGMNALIGANGILTTPSHGLPTDHGIRALLSQTVTSGLDQVHPEWRGSPHGGRGVVTFLVEENKLKIEHVTYQRQESAAEDAI